MRRRDRTQRSGRPISRFASSRPPSISMILPVTKLAAGDARYSAHSAMSAGSPEPLQRRSPHHLVADRGIFEDDFERGRRDRTDRDAVDAHLRREVGRHEPRHVAQRTLRSAVRDEAAVAQPADRGRDVDDRALAGARAGAGAAALLSTNAVVTLKWNERSRKPGLVSRNGRGIVPPALLTTMSSRPNSSTVRSTMPVTASLSLTSVGSTSARRPSRALRRRRRRAVPSCGRRARRRRPLRRTSARSRRRCRGRRR